jgi:hypothetical protein
MALGKLTFLRLRHFSLDRAIENLEHNRNLLADIDHDADVRRLREKATICLLKVQELRADIAELIEKLEGQ